MRGTSMEDKSQLLLLLESFTIVYTAWEYPLNPLYNSHHLCGTIPFSVYMKNRIQESISVLSYPKEFNGIKLSFLQDDVSTEECNIYERIPSWFWLGPTFEKLPINKAYRKRLCYELFDFNHKDLCSTETFHIPDEECKCKFCKDSCSHFHERYCPEMT